MRWQLHISDHSESVTASCWNGQHIYFFLFSLQGRRLVGSPLLDNWRDRLHSQQLCGSSGLYPGRRVCFVLFSLNYLILKVGCHNRMPLTLGRRGKKFTVVIKAWVFQAFCPGFYVLCNTCTVINLMFFLKPAHLFWKKTFYQYPKWKPSITCHRLKVAIKIWNAS